MSASITDSLLFLGIVLLGQVFLSVAYTALANARKKILKERADSGSKSAQRALALSENASGLVMVYQYASLVMCMLMAAILTAALSPSLSEWLGTVGVDSEWSERVAFLIILPPAALLLLLVGHQLPSAVVAGRAEIVAILITPVMWGLISMLAPLLRLTHSLSQQVGKLLGGSGETTLITEEEIKTLVDAGSEVGVIEDEEKDMIYSVFKFGDTVVRELMVPRIDIVALDVEASIDQALDKIIQAGHSRIPVYEETIDNIKGVLYAKDLLSLWRSNQQDSKLVNILREPYFVPESKKADELLEDLRSRETHIAIVIDEYGGTAGLVTIEDLLEVIVGDIRDEYDFFEEADYEMISETEYICNAGISLDDLNELLEIGLPTDENDTLGGYIFSQLGKIPEIGDKVIANGVEMEVLTLKGRRRINKVRVQKLPDSDTISEAETAEAS